MQPRRTSWLFVLPLVGASAAVAASCGGGSHIYGGYSYDTVHDCLGAIVTLDILDGDDPGANCAAKCLKPTLLGPDAGDVVYVSLECPPYPHDFDTSGLSPTCDRAVAALERSDFCLADGGSSHPEQDAGQDAAPVQDSGPAQTDAGDAGK